MADKNDQKKDPSIEKDAIEESEQEAAETEEKVEEPAAETPSDADHAEEENAAPEASEEVASEEEASEEEASEEEASEEEASEEEASEEAGGEVDVHDVPEDGADAEAAESTTIVTEHGFVDTPDLGLPTGEDEPIKGLAAYFDLPDDLMDAAARTAHSKYKKFDAYSPFPIHGMDDAMRLGRSWIPWVTFGAGAGGFLTANALQFGTMTFDWPMIIGGKPFAPWPSFVPIMFELTVLLAGVTTAAVMLVAAGCFRKPFIIDREITNDRFVLWISADDEAFDQDEVKAFMETLNPVEIRTITKGA